jgi:hypothetical protein
MVQGVEFRPKDVIRNPGEHRIDYILMKPCHASGEHRHEGEKWSIRLEKNEKPVATIYFSKEDAKTFLEKVKKSARPFLVVH